MPAAESSATWASATRCNDEPWKLGPDELPFEDMGASIVMVNEWVIYGGFMINIWLMVVNKWLIMVNERLMMMLIVWLIYG